jgi:hypothetical protein
MEDGEYALTIVPQIISPSIIDIIFNGSMTFSINCNKQNSSLSWTSNQNKPSEDESGRRMEDNVQNKKRFVRVVSNVF